MRSQYSESSHFTCTASFQPASSKPHEALCVRSLTLHLNHLWVFPSERQKKKANPNPGVRTKWKAMKLNTVYAEKKRISLNNSLRTDFICRKKKWLESIQSHEFLSESGEKNKKKPNPLWYKLSIHDLVIEFSQTQ